MEGIIGVHTCFAVIHIYVRFRALIELIQVGLCDTRPRKRMK